MTKILDLDKLVPAARFIKHNGVEHKIDEMTVDNFLETTAAAERLKGEQSMAVQVAATIAMIQRSVPSWPAEELRKLPLENLQKVTAFIRGDDVEGAEAAPEGEAGK
ncbi:hypothetical protein ACODYM_29280 [Burkholderia gladioli]|uniref:hypothetical protein n=1 Tax=Burkholderia gladioli TaxID=28095 RepID=UPI003B502E4E